MTATKAHNVLEPLLLVVLLGIMPFFIYFSLLEAGFIMIDDPNEIWNNPLTRDLSLSSAADIFAGIRSNQYSPLSYLTFAVEIKLFGTDPFIVHFNNLLLHVANGLMVYFLCRLLSSSMFTAFLTASLFAFHPIQVETVGWCIQRRTLLYVFFFLIALINYLHYARTGSKASYRLSICFFALSCLSKGLAVSFPVLLILCDFLLEKEKHSIIYDKLPYIVISIIFSLVAIKAAAGGMQNIPFCERILIGGEAFMAYISNLILPYRLSTFYPLPNPHGCHNIRLWLSGTVCSMLLFTLTITSLRQTRKVFFGFFWYAVNIAPLVFVPVGIDILGSDHFAYLPVIGIFFTAASGIERIFRSVSGRADIYRKILTMICCILWIVSLSVISHGKTNEWQDTESWFSGFRNNIPALFQPHPLPFKALSDHMVRQGRFRESLPGLDTAIAINPRDDEAYYLRAIAYLKLGCAERALIDIDRSMALLPLPICYYLRGVISLELDNPIQAVRAFNRYIDSHPGDIEACKLRASAHIMLGDMQKALNDSEYLISRIPWNPAGYLLRCRINFSRKAYLLGLWDCWRSFRSNSGVFFFKLTERFRVSISERFCSIVSVYANRRF